MLSTLQIKTLAIEARKAWRGLSTAERAEAQRLASEAANDPLGVSEAQDFTHWRREVQIQVTGKLSMRDMVNEDFNHVLARWKWHQGDAVAAANRAAKATDQSRGRGWSFDPALPRRSVGWWIGNVASASACTLFVAFVAALLWSAS